MKIVIAPDSFKESMSALQAADAIGKGIEKIFPEAEVVKVPMADGGEGTVQSLVDATKGEMKSAAVTGPAGVPVDAFYGITGDGKTAIIEMAAASGLHLVPIGKRNPLLTTTKGTGELILAAVDSGVTHLIIGLGGSATNDGGAGMAQALGVRLLKADGQQIGPGGEELRHLDSIDLTTLDPRLKEVTIELACDVDNPLTGERGASRVYARQKGATEGMIDILEGSLAHYAHVIKRDIGKDVDNIPGAGAAGGLGAGFLAFLEADMRKGIDLVMDAAGLEHHLVDADLVITGEGRIDGQTVYGKAPIGVAGMAKKRNLPVIGVAGTLGEGWQAVYEHGIDAVYSIVPGAIPLETALLHAEKYTEELAGNIARTVKMWRG
ncbi:glycerate kinase [Bacillus salacetis]|uniref:Glycerate kinase n=1 Tax=Bacillus salacetis TaxID=2315464 RepID=A0A3A1QVP3_9BACI|nr:glycerate kinase [Bacillus salacetis]RIW32052.1 glycerate kinase [Bacillus salacetis]